MIRAWLVLATLVLAAGACRPLLEDDASFVFEPTILAVRAEPPEARPGEKTTLTALYSDGTRSVATAALGWSFCSARRSLAESDPLDPSCLSGEALALIGRGAQVGATLPRDACRVFGPDRPLAAKSGESAGRPADPDGTGGYFQPGLVGGGGANAILFEVRVRCALPSVTQEVALDFERRYQPNQNPAVAEIARMRDEPSAAGEPVAEGAVIAVAPGESVRLRVRWAEAAAERYPSYDNAARVLVDRRESIAVAWRATQGTFPRPRTSRDEADLATTSDNEWLAPAVATAATLFVVLRDARGGTAFRTVDVRVQ